MKLRIGHRSIEIRERVQGGVVGHVLTKGEDVTTSCDPGSRQGLKQARKTSTLSLKPLAGSNPAPAPYRSKLEARYAQYLDAMKYGHAIDAWQYEPLNFRLPGKKNFYKPDFLVQAYDKLTFVDVKGFNKSDDRSLVKVKVIAGMNRWARFVQVRYQKGAWIERVIE